MALQFIFGSAGSGKSTFLYDMISKQATEHRDKQYFVLVPDQFTLETQKLLVERSGGGILNIDVLSFQRLAFRVFEQIPALERTILEDMGKTMLLRKVFSEQKDNLTYFKKGIDKPGFLDECKSFLCELEQYGIREEEDFEKLLVLGGKFADIQRIYECFREKLGDTYMMAEELTVQLTQVVHEMEGIRGSVICLDGFTGFTPTQYELLARLLELSSEMYVTVTTDSTGRRNSLFGISGETITSLTKLANQIPTEVKEPIVTGRNNKEPWRFHEDGELSFLEKNIFCYPCDEWEAPTEDISLYVGRNPAEETSYVAYTIWWMVARQGYRFEDFAVITGDIPSYELDLSREFSRMGIRYFMDYKKSIGSNWVAEYIQAVLEMFQKNMDSDSTFRFLRCGLSPLTSEQTDCLENYVLATGKRGLKAYERTWKRQVANYDLEEINTSRQIVCECIRELFQDFGGGSKQITDFTKALYAFLVREGVYEKMQQQSEVFAQQGKDILAREYRNVYKVVMNLFDEMVELMGEEVVTAEEYRQILSAGISEGLVGFIPPKKNQVVIGDIQRTRLKDVRVLFFVGFSEDIVPGGIQSPGLVNTRERRRIEEMGISLAPTGAKKTANDLFYLYLAFTRPSEKLFFTYSENTAAGEERHPSYVLRRIGKIFPALTTTYASQDDSPEHMLGTDGGLRALSSGLVDEGYLRGNGRDRWWQLWGYYRDQESGEPVRQALALHFQGRREGRLSERALESLYGDELHGSITRLEQFAKCPYSYFIRYGLSLRERDEYTVDAPDLGNVVHYTLKELSDCLRERNIRWRDLDEKSIEPLVEECMERVVTEYRSVLFLQSRRIEYMVTRMKHMMKRTVWAISEQMRRGAFEQEYSELGFSWKDNLPEMSIQLGDGKRLVFSGIIDRIDTCIDNENIYVKVVDYKTGGVKLSLNSMFYGLQMQLVLYLMAAMGVEKSRNADKQVIPAGMFYYYVKDPVLRLEREDADIDLEEALLTEYKCSGYANAAPEILQRLDSVFGVGGFLESGVKSSCVPVNVTKSGDFGRGAKVLENEAWKQLMEHTMKQAGTFGRQIMNGVVEASPCDIGGEKGCEYCRLQSICGIERTEFAQKCRRLEEKNEDEIWKALREEGGAGDEVDEGAETGH